MGMKIEREEEEHREEGRGSFLGSSLFGSAMPSRRNLGPNIRGSLERLRAVAIVAPIFIGRASFLCARSDDPEMIRLCCEVGEEVSAFDLVTRQEMQSLPPREFFLGPQFCSKSRELESER